MAGSELPAIGEIVTLASAMPLDGHVTDYSALGDAVHAFFAADVEGLSDEERVGRARRLLAPLGAPARGAGMTSQTTAAPELAGIVRPGALVEAADRLREFVEARWPGAVWHREIAVEARVGAGSGERRVVGIIDLLVETESGYLIFDHKTFPGRTEAAWRSRVKKFVPQFAAYAAALRAGGRAVAGGWVHLPAGGGLVEVRV